MDIQYLAGSVILKEEVEGIYEATVFESGACGSYLFTGLGLDGSQRLFPAGQCEYATYW